ncbi:MAG: hypothetical protein HKN57_13135 [Xanthomonadales bacterium]|nr:type II secretion system F family protein [Gammaproteobacteria bacterium]NND58182.1 hypothetical protein [Xanthomonadales bacterium]NNK50039.1 hypothetical protein [Xanthomonadales bacterium]
MRQRELEARHRAQLFSQLAQTGKAGLSAADSIHVMVKSADRSLQQPLRLFWKQLAAGKDIAQAGLKSAVFLSWEARLIQAAEASGKLVESYAGLARRHANRARRYQNLKRGMTLPLALFVLAVLAAPLPGLLLGNINFESYLLNTTGRLLLLFGSLYLLSRGWRRLGATGADNALFRLLLRTPWAGKLIRRQQQHDCLLSLALLLDAGVPAFQALGVAADSVSHPTLRAQFAGAENAARRGSSVTGALESGGILPDEQMKNLVKAGEFSGRLSEQLYRVADQLDEQLEMQFKVISDWAPKTAYFAVVVLFVL